MDPRVIQKVYDFFKLEDKVAIITGAGNGIGKATAIMMAGLGARVVACDIETERVNETVAEITRDGLTAMAFTCDITQPNQIQSLVDRTLEIFGTVDILVNNGATLGGGKLVDEVDEPEFDRLIDVNLKGVYHFIKAVLPIMRAKQYGKIVSVSSVAAIAGDFSDIHYSAAKGGVIAMSKTLARELAQEKINVNVVAPGLTNTRMAHEWEFPSALERFHRIGEPEDMAAAICFLASDAAGYFSGQVISPNGGEYMQ
ncbi:SDR family NAD(P)-dependent oxidoreductase [Anoxynatronum buryatiense]|uniref:3-oxoacyl-[acyl-carrier protein] reductase/2-hydroxycyclohexanecarboxyl-CoA dehydrogenase n=1 Tax=Anoxynatronum buryatiense TaxID=489973 RepID=A0AA46AHL0_9CLOT|nr:SDR family NAD(P)-dependent oxidoreductase [Anoxynatronum buryatiense]SMP40631.1 3-oxoacyl-[acyl-carrier protein] reductase/2-hydroxycyclohexanecarboxyl-CoA dehydrogenase [Anoxynatronum buryatiense]